MHQKRILGLAAVTLVLGAGPVLAGHVVPVNPATVPTGFLAAHVSVDDVPVAALVRAITPDGTDVFVQHVRLDPNTPTGWHTHPGPAIVSVVSGSVTYQDAGSNACESVTYSAGEGLVDRGFGHVHRAIGGGQGVDFYVVYLLPPGSTTHLIPASAPALCS